MYLFLCAKDLKIKLKLMGVLKDTHLLARTPRNIEVCSVFSPFSFSLCSLIFFPSLLANHLLRYPFLLRWAPIHPQLASMVVGCLQ